MIYHGTAQPARRGRLYGGDACSAQIFNVESVVGLALPRNKFVGLSESGAFPARKFHPSSRHAGADLTDATTDMTQH